MNLIITAFQGQLADAPESTETDNGTPVCTAVVLIDRRTKEDGMWVDAEPTRRRINAWRTNTKKLTCSCAATPPSSSAPPRQRLDRQGHQREAHRRSRHRRRTRQRPPSPHR